MNTNTDKSLILNEIKSAYNFRSDADFARFLGIPRTTLSTWRNRNSLDYELLYSKCDGLSGDFLLSGKGEVRRISSPRESNQQKHTNDDQDQLKEIIALQKKVIELQDKLSSDKSEKVSNDPVRGMARQLK